MGGFEVIGRRGSGEVGGAKGTESGSLWLAPNPSKRWGELFFLSYTAFWLTLCLGIVVPYKLNEGLIAAAPTFLIPLVLVGKVTEECLERAIAVCKDGASFKKIGKRISEIAKRYDFGVVERFVGHGVGTVFHSEPIIMHNRKSLDYHF